MGALIYPIGSIWTHCFVLLAGGLAEVKVLVCIADCKRWLRSGSVIGVEMQWIPRGKYPPAEPRALLCEPLKAAEWGR